MLKQNKEKILGNIILSMSIIVLTLGSMFWIFLIKYGFFIFLGAAITAILYISESLPYNSNKKMKKSTRVLGIIGLILLMLTLGIQSPQLPFKKYVLLLGIVLSGYFLFKLLRKKPK